VANTNWPGMSASGDRVYVAHGPRVLAVDVAEEELVWSFPAESTPSTQFFAAPSVNDGQVVVGDYGTSGGLLSPGMTVSVYAFEDAESGTPSASWISSEEAQDRIIAPAYQVGDQVFIGTADNFVIALNGTSGQLQWQYETDLSIWGQPAYEDGVVYAASMDGGLYALDGDTGTLIWSQQFEGAIPGTPVLGEQLIYVGSFDENAHALDKKSGEIIWSAPAQAVVWSGTALAENLIFYADIAGNVYAVDALSGSEVWTHNTDQLLQATPVVADGVVYIAAAGNPSAEQSERRGMLLALSVEDGQELWRAETSAPLFSTPVIVGDDIVIALQTEEALLIVYDRLDGSRVWSYAPPAES
jgi:outer membrane protein assembly factor BamB